MAALLAVVRGDAIEERPSIDARISGLDRDALQHLVLRLTRRDPDLAEIIEDEIHMGVGPPGESSPVRPPKPAGCAPPDGQGAPPSTRLHRASMVHLPSWERSL